MRDKDGLGKDFVLHGLNSPVINNRNMTINVIESWSPNLVDDDVLTVIKKAIKTETNEDVKKRLLNLVKLK